MMGANDTLEQLEAARAYAVELEAKIARLTELAGATSEPEPYVAASTAGEFAARWNAHTVEERERAWEHMRDAMDRGYTCFTHDHPGIIKLLEGRLKEIRRREEGKHE